MKVFYDHTAFIPPFGGVAKYHVEVMKRLPPHMYVLSAIGKPISQRKWTRALYPAEAFERIEILDDTDNGGHDACSAI